MNNLVSNKNGLSTIPYNNQKLFFSYNENFEVDESDMLSSSGYVVFPDNAFTYLEIPEYESITSGETKKIEAKFKILDPHEVDQEQQLMYIGSKSITTKYISVVINNKNVSVKYKEESGSETTLLTQAINASADDFFVSIAKNGKNVFDGGNKWSKESLFAVGGLMKHSEALTSITCSTVNSYNGLVPRVGGFEGGTVTWAPTNITYGHNNRSAQFRLPQNRYCIENRAADMTMNVYLAFSMTLSAAVEGIKKKIHPGKPTDQDLYNMTESEFKKLGIKRLPRNLLMALEALKKDDFSDEVIGSVMKKSLLTYKNDEWERYHQAVTDWEVKEYLRLY